MPRSPSLPKRRFADGVWFTSEQVTVKNNRQPVQKWRCQHPLCSNPLQSRHLSRHVRIRHSYDYNAYHTTGATVPMPETHEAQAQADHSPGHGTRAVGTSFDAVHDPLIPNVDVEMMTGHEPIFAADIQGGHQQVQSSTDSIGNPPHCIP
jgi:hypothetical protein